MVTNIKTSEQSVSCFICVNFAKGFEVRQELSSAGPIHNTDSRSYSNVAYALTTVIYDVYKKRHCTRRGRTVEVWRIWKRSEVVVFMGQQGIPERDRNPTTIEKCTKDLYRAIQAKHR